MININYTELYLQVTRGLKTWMHIREGRAGHMRSGLPVCRALKLQYRGLNNLQRCSLTDRGSYVVILEHVPGALFELLRV